MAAANQTAIDWAKSILAQWGLSTLAGSLDKFVKDGMSNDQLAFALRDTAQYKARFKGNELRRAAGLRELTPAEYVGVEEQYHQIAQSYGLPASFYDSHDDFTKFIGGDVSATEFESRVKVASDSWLNADAGTKAAWKGYYGLDDGHAVAAILDQKTALPVLEQHAAAAGIGGAASQQGLSVSKSRAEQFAQFGVSLDQARKAYSEIGQSLPNAQAVGARFGEQVGQSTLEDATLLGSGAAQSQLQRLASAEGSEFGGHQGADTKTVAVNQNF